MKATNVTHLINRIKEEKYTIITLDSEKAFDKIQHLFIGEGDGTPLQCSCLENPRDQGAWWAAVYGVAQSRTRLKRISSSNIYS